MPRPAQCRYCGREIAFARLVPAGKPIPLDLSPDPELGSLHRTFATGPDGRPTSTVVQLKGHDLAEARERARRNPGDRTSRLWVPHFETCTRRRIP